MPSDADMIVEKCSFIYVRKIGQGDMRQSRQRKVESVGVERRIERIMTVI
jgi:hypothetical protein